MPLYGVMNGICFPTYANPASRPPRYGMSGPCTASSRVSSAKQVERRPSSRIPGILERSRDGRNYSEARNMNDLTRSYLCQLPWTGRGEGGARQGRLRGQLRKARRAQGQVRPHEPLPHELEHHAREVANLRSARPLGSRGITDEPGEVLQLKGHSWTLGACIVMSSGLASSNPPSRMDPSRVVQRWF